VESAAGTDAAILREEFVAALTAGDANLAEIIALDAIAGGVAVADLYVDVVGPALEHVGHRWETGEMTIADEHLATGIAHDVMRLISRTATTHPRRSRERLLLAAISGEGHVTGLRMIGDLAEGRGFDVRYLGAALPVETIADIVGKHEPELVGLSVTMPGQAARLTGALEQVLASGHAPRGILVGGRAVPEPLRTDARVRYAADARAAIAIIEELADPV
jgi:methanogenic corrinoid protein MtbC1